ncbi:MAG: hydroxyacylglutathione hydrolase [Gammaproteobacteria bacterium]|nr:hydroxyacylglutathione hydrolase [Gammaproteobacteria bacterium]
MLQIHPVPAFRDNYFWLFHQEGDHRAWIVDPGDAGPVEAALAERNLTLAGIVVTHHHFDHTGGVSQLAATHGAEVVGPRSREFTAIDRVLGDGDRVTLAGCEFEVIEVPGHTLDHIAYHCAAEGVLFCGDTLFAGGCGRLFEGTPEQMHRSLSRLAALPGATRVYCAHEYTLANLAFARQVEPGNEALGEREQKARQLRDDDVPTVPSTIELELATNPFLRSDEPAVIRAAEGHAGRSLEAGVGTLAEIRRWKDAS